jgi:hypothetical protein
MSSSNIKTIISCTTNLIDSSPNCNFDEIINQRKLLLAQQNVNIFRENFLNTTTNDYQQQAGGQFITSFPSSCENITFEKALLKKKAYMFKNIDNNALSSDFTYGTGLTRNQQLSNMGKGFLPNGQRLGTGLKSLDISNDSSNSNTPKLFRIIICQKK